MPTVIERINAGLESDTPSRVEWRALLETALFEIERLRAALRKIRTKADAGHVTENNLNQIGHIADEALAGVGHEQNLSGEQK